MLYNITLVTSPAGRTQLLSTQQSVGYVCGARVRMCRGGNIEMCMPVLCSGQWGVSGFGVGN